MQIKKFEAPTIQEALDHVKKELGPEAIILQTKNHKRAFGLMSKASVEITAAVSERSLHKKHELEKRMPTHQKDQISRLSAIKQAEIFEKYSDKSLKSAQQTQERISFQSPPKKLTATRYIDIVDQPSSHLRSFDTEKVAVETPSLSAPPGLVEEEVRALKKMVQEMSSQLQTSEALYRTLESSQFKGPIQDLFDQLVLHGVDRKYAFLLVKKVAFEINPKSELFSEELLDSLAKEIMESVHVESLFSDMTEEPCIYAMVGPTGVGKTTTVAKIASLFKTKHHARVGLINLDQDKTYAFAQLGTYAKILNVPFRSATSKEDLESALKDFKKLDVILIDTAGRTPRDLESLKATQKLLDVPIKLRTLLVLSATTRDQDLYEMIQRFSLFQPKGLIVSKLDEASVYGSIYNLTQKAKLPLLSFTTGQKVPDDIENATVERVASLVMNL